MTETDVETARRARAERVYDETATLATGNLIAQGASGFFGFAANIFVDVAAIPFYARRGARSAASTARARSPRRRPGPTKSRISASSPRTCCGTRSSARSRSRVHRLGRRAHHRRGAGPDGGRARRPARQ